MYKSELTPKFLRKISKNIETLEKEYPTICSFYMCHKVKEEAQEYNTLIKFQNLLKQHKVPLSGSLGYRGVYGYSYRRNPKYMRNANTVRIMFLELLALEMEDCAKEDEAP